MTYLAIDLIRNRSETTHGDAVRERFAIHGVPRDLQGAFALAHQSKFEFERWARYLQLAEELRARIENGELP